MNKLLLFTALFTLPFSLSKLSAQSYDINTFAGDGPGFFGDGGPATAANFESPTGVAVDAAGNIYIADLYNQRIRMVNTNGIISTIAGGAAFGYAGDGGMATDAELYDPMGIAVDKVGNLYIADYSNNEIRKVNTSGIITTIAGNYAYGAGLSGDGGPATAAELHEPYGVAVDTSGNVYIADMPNDCVRKVTTDGIIHAFAGNGYGAGTGNGGYTGDGGQATDAELYQPSSVAIDDSGNAYITDRIDNHVRKVNTGGIITSIAGNGTAIASGDGGPATAAGLNTPYGIGVDKVGNVYVADINEATIRLINTSGIIATIAGNGNFGFTGDGGPATSAELSEPTGVVSDARGNVYIADQGNARIRILNSAATGVNEVKGEREQVKVYPDPNNGKFTIQFVGAQRIVSSYIEIYNVLGEKVLTGTLQGNNSIDISSQPDGMYFYRVISESATLVGEGKIEIEK